MAGRKGRPKEYFGCDIAGCKGSHHARGLCQNHYRQEMRMEQRGESPIRRCQAGGCSLTRHESSVFCLGHHLERMWMLKGAPRDWLEFPDDD